LSVTLISIHKFSEPNKNYSYTTLLNVSKLVYIFGELGLYFSELYRLITKNISLTHDIS